MLPEAFWESVVTGIRAETGNPLEQWKTRSLGGGCINAAHSLTDSATGTAHFVKVNDAALVDMFAAEAEALAEILATKTIRVPAPVCSGTACGQAFLVLEFIEMSGPRTAETESAMGRRLAALHRVTSPDGRFGWRRDNTIGSTPQHNSWSKDWPSFFAEHRLGFQLDLAARNGRSFSRAEALLDSVPSFFESYSPTPSLLHGDLWGGNAAVDSEGNPVIFDPATYYGDRETDLAFTEMFGGFGPLFYESYRESFPVDPGYGRRAELYNLYHVLNHFNLFGGAYASQAERIMARLLGARKSSD